VAALPEKHVFVAETPHRQRALRWLLRATVALTGAWLIALLVGGLGYGRMPLVPLPPVGKLQHGDGAPAAGPSSKGRSTPRTPGTSAELPFSAPVGRTAPVSRAPATPGAPGSAGIGGAAGPGVPGQTAPGRSGSTVPSKTHPAGTPTRTRTGKAPAPAQPAKTGRGANTTPGTPRKKVTEPPGVTIRSTSGP
jgi:hypothetical protein